MNFKTKYIGSRAFYRTLLILVIPLIIQQGITNFVSLLDNVMVGKLGTLQMSSVSIVNQLIFVFNLAVFGGLSGASIFGTQFFGVSDWKGMRDTFRFKMIFSVVISALAVGAFILWGEELIMLFLKSEENTPEEIASTLSFALGYLKIAVVGLIPFAIVQTYSSTLRETGETVFPMIAGCIAIGVNLVFNYLLIYGKFGFPALGVEGAALATVMSRFVEAVIVIYLTHKRHDKYKFIEGAYKSLAIPTELIKKIVVTGTPLMINEVLWSLAMTFINQNYSIRGIDVVAATNIATTSWNLFSVIMMAMGSAAAILVGQKLGASDRDGAIDTSNKLIFVSLVIHLLIAVLIIISAPLVPLLYNVEPEVRKMATYCLIIAGCMIPLSSTIHMIYFTIRSGGKTVITFLFDSVYTWCIPAVLSLILCKYTSIDIIFVYLIVQTSDIIKLAIGLPMLKSGFWANCVIGKVKSN